MLGIMVNCNLQLFHFILKRLSTLSYFIWLFFIVLLETFHESFSLFIYCCCLVDQLFEQQQIKVI